MSGQPQAPASLNATKKKPWCQLNRRVGGSRSRSGRFQKRLGAMSGFHRGVNEVFALLGCYAALIRSKLPTFRNSLSDKRCKNSIHCCYYYNCCFVFVFLYRTIRNAFLHAIGNIRTHVKHDGTYTCVQKKTELFK
jgi:hypothetical protein